MTSTRRQFMTSALVGGGMLALGGTNARAATLVAPFATPLTQHELPFPPDTLEPVLDASTLRLQWGGHHAQHLEALGALLRKAPELARFSAEGLVSNLSQAPAGLRTALRQHAGGHLNHAILWNLLTPPERSQFARRSDLGRALRATFGGEEGFRRQFKETGQRVFGSGWAWVCTRANGTLFLTTTENEDNPLMPEANREIGFPVLGIDLWEHAYYLRYEHERSAYLDAMLRCLDWAEADRRYRVRSFAERL